VLIDVAYNVYYTFLNTYRAFPRKVIDGDTVWVVVDLGFKDYTLRKLRLRGIDCPELKTAKGKEAKLFVEKAILGLDHIIIHSSKSGKFARYLADIFVPSRPLIKRKAMDAPRAKRAGVTTEKYMFLNQELVDEGLAVLWKD